MEAGRKADGKIWQETGYGGHIFLIGIQEIGNITNKFSKEQKQDLMHVAVCSLLSQSGYYKLEGYDDEGWPHFLQLKELACL